MDASVGAKLALPEEGAEAAHALFVAHVEGRVRALHVPDHFFAECGHAMRRGGPGEADPAPREGVNQGQRSSQSPATRCRVPARRPWSFLSAVRRGSPVASDRAT